MAVVVYKADDGSGNVNTYWIASDADAGAVPEPSSAVLFGAGLAALCIRSAFRRVRKRGLWFRDSPMEI
jgi:hypothetical protein